MFNAIIDNDVLSGANNSDSSYLRYQEEVIVVLGYYATVYYSAWLRVLHSIGILHAKQSLAHSFVDQHKHEIGFISQA